MRATAVLPDGTAMRWVELPGGGPARVYLHGFGSCSAAYYPAAAAHPALAGVRSLLVDLLGFGLSDRPADAGYGPQEQADRVATVLTGADVEAADVIAHSAGADVAILLATRHPHLVRRLVLVDPNLGVYPASSLVRQIADQTETAFLRQGWTEALIAAGPHWAATMRLAGRTALHRTAAALCTGTGPGMRELLLGLTIPRALLRPAADGPFEDAGAMTAAGVRFLPIPRCGHNIMIDNVDGFASAVAAFLADPADPAVPAPPCSGT